MDDLRARYKALKAKADAAYAAAEPQRQALREAEKPWNALQEKLENLVDGADVQTCESCLEPIFEGEKRAVGDDVTLCENCAPEYDYMLRHPEHFQNSDGEPMTPAEAKALCDAHVAAGGALTDKMVT